MFKPKARYRFYGSPANYFHAAGHAAARLLGSGRDDRPALERKVADLIGVSDAICMPQARFGLYMIFSKLLSPERPEVVMSPYTIHDVVNMVLCAGGRPVFADIEPETCNIDPAQIEALVGERTGAVLVTHLHGLACDMKRIQAICRDKGVPLIEDAAQAFGARVGGKLVGGFGEAAIFSFGRAKNINAFYGGMVVTTDPGLAQAIRSEAASYPEEASSKLVKRIIHCGVGDVATSSLIYSLITFRLFRYGALKGVESVNKIVQTESNPRRKDAIPEGYRRQMTSMQAHVIMKQLPQVDENFRRRLELARIYHEGLQGLPGILLPPWRDDGSHVYLQYPVQVANRWEYVRYMMKHGRDLAIQHMGSAAEIEVFRDFHRDCPHARRTAEEVVLLPTYPGYGADEARANVAVTAAFLRGCGAER